MNITNLWKEICKTYRDLDLDFFLDLDLDLFLDLDLDRLREWDLDLRLDLDRRLERDLRLERERRRERDLRLDLLLLDLDRDLDLLCRLRLLPSIPNTYKIYIINKPFTIFIIKKTLTRIYRC